MVSSRRLLGALAVLACLLPAGSGCVALVAGGAAAGVAGYAYVKGEGTRTYAPPVRVTAEATREALADLGLHPTAYRVDDLGAVVEATSATGKPIKIRMKAAGDATTVRVRVGHFGDEELTDRVFAQIDQRLAAPIIVSQEGAPTAR